MPVPGGEALAVTHVIELKQWTTRGSFSGAEQHLFTLVRGQARAGLRVALVVLVGRPGPDIVAKAADLRAAGIEVTLLGARRPHRTWPRRALRLLALPRLARVLARRRAHVVHTHLMYASMFASPIAYLAGCRMVVNTIHNDEPYFATRRWRLLLRLLDRASARHVAISQNVKDHMARVAGWDGGRIDVVHYGIEPPAEAVDRAAVRRRHGIATDRFAVAFVGRLTYQKNVELLLGALAALPDVQGVIVGSGEMEDELRRLGARICPGQARFLGHRSDAVDIIAACDALCLPSRWEGLGLVLLEAMVRRVPIVGTRAGAIPEILGDGDYGVVVPPGDAAALADGLRLLRDRPAVARELAVRAYEHARRTFTVEAMVARTTAVYMAVQAGRGRPVSAADE